MEGDLEARFGIRELELRPVVLSNSGYEIEAEPATRQVAGSIEAHESFQDSLAIRQWDPVTVIADHELGGSIPPARHDIDVAGNRRSRSRLSSRERSGMPQTFHRASTVHRRSGTLRHSPPGEDGKNAGPRSEPVNTLPGNRFPLSGCRIVRLTA